MLENLATFLGRKDRADGTPQIETFGKSKIARQLGDEILKATRQRRNHIQGIRERLSSMTREQKDDLVDRLFARVALFVFDLPASEASHHSGRFGLLDHLLEVAHQTVRDLSSPAFEVSKEHSTNHREKPLWVYAGMVAAIAHDIGKPLDLDVSAPGSSKRWDPTAEPLRLFCDRYGLPETGPALWHFHVGRGLRGHEKHIASILPIVLTPAVEDYLGTRLASVIDAMTVNAEWKPVGGKSQPAHDVVRVVRRVDTATSRIDVSERQGSAEEPGRPAPPVIPVAPAVVPPLQPPLPFPPIVVVQTDTLPRSEKERPVPPPRVASLADDDDDDEDPLWVPPDFRPEPVPAVSARRGDPTEQVLRLEAELQSDRFMDLLRRMLIRRLSRNGLCTQAYICQDYVWLILPRALERVAKINRHPWDQITERAMLGALRTSPLVVRDTPRRMKVFVRPMAGGASYQAVRLLTRSFLSPDEVKFVGTYAYHLQALTPPASSAAEA
jgi:hypothetical protein